MAAKITTREWMCVGKGLNAAGLAALVIHVLFSVGGQLLIKLGVDQSPDFSMGMMRGLTSIINAQTIIGLAVYSLGTFMWMVTLTKLDLSYALPASSVQYVLVYAGAWAVLGEPLHISRVVGIGIICVGVVIMSTGSELR